MEDFKYNLSKSPNDVRDWKFSNVVCAPLNIPKAFSLKDFCGPVRNQGKYGFCHSFAGAEVKNIQECRETGAKFNLSPLYLASKVKSLDEFPDTEGSNLVSVCKALVKYGTCSEPHYPYEQYSEFLKFPEFDKNVPMYKINANYTRLFTVQEMKESIAMFKPVLYGVTVCDNFRQAKEFVKMPQGFILGGHAMVLVGYDDEKDFGDGHKGYFLTKNSHGKDWGIDGYSWIPYDYFTARFTVFNKDDGAYFTGDAWNMIDLQNDPIKGKVIEMQIGNNEVLVNGKKVTIDQAPFTTADTGRTMVPLRAIAQMFDCDVLWDGNSKRIVILKEEG